MKIFHDKFDPYRDFEVETENPHSHFTSIPTIKQHLIKVLITPEKSAKGSSRGSSYPRKFLKPNCATHTLQKQYPIANNLTANLQKPFQLHPIPPIAKLRTGRDSPYRKTRIRSQIKQIPSLYDIKNVKVVKSMSTTLPDRPGRETNKCTSAQVNLHYCVEDFVRPLSAYRMPTQTPHRRHKNTKHYAKKTENVLTRHTT